MMRRTLVGVVCGLLATASYDASKFALSQWDSSPYNPFEAIHLFGLLLVDSTAPEFVVDGAAWFGGRKGNNVGNSEQPNWDEFLAQNDPSTDQPWEDSTPQDIPEGWQNKPDETINKDVEILVEKEGQDLPNRLKGEIEAVGPATHEFNCFGFAVDPYDPYSVGWVPGREGIPTNPAPQRVPRIRGDVDLLNLFTSHRWKVTPFDQNPPTDQEERVVLYAYKDSEGAWQYTHAAVWRSDGIFAKMGQLGTFRFESLEQMAGGTFGNPHAMLKRTRVLPTEPN
jgi:hypothetical protein